MAVGMVVDVDVERAPPYVGHAQLFSHRHRLRNPGQDDYACDPYQPSS